MSCNPCWECVVSLSRILVISNVIWDLQFSLVAQVVKTLPAVGSSWVHSLGREDPLEKGMANQSSILAWKIPWQRNPVSYTVHGVTKSWTLYKFKVCELNRNLGNGLETQLSLKRLFLWEKYILPIPSRTHYIYISQSSDSQDKLLLLLHWPLCTLTFMPAMGVAFNFWLKRKRKSELWGSWDFILLFNKPSLTVQEDDKHVT